MTDTATPVQPNRYVLAHALANLTTPEWEALTAGARQYDAIGLSTLPATTNPNDVKALIRRGFAADYANRPPYATVAGLRFVETVDAMYATFLGRFDAGNTGGSASDWWVCPCGNQPDGHGLYAVMPDGTETEPDADWAFRGRHYGCAACGRYGSADARDPRERTVPVIGICAALPVGMLTNDL